MVRREEGILLDKIQYGKWKYQSTDNTIRIKRGNSKKKKKKKNEEISG